MVMYPGPGEAAPPPRRRSAWWRFVWRHLPGLSVFFLTSILLAVVLWPYVVITVPSGRVGVLWRRFYGFDLYCGCFVGRGTTLDPRELREEGLHLIWPWDRLFLYNLRLQSATQIYNAISKDGVNVTTQISIRYQLAHNSVAVLHKFIGPNYLTTVVGPEIGSQAREVISQYTAEEVYTSREAIQAKIRENAQKSLGANLNKLVQPEAMEELDPRHYNDFLQGSIQILDTLVLSIELPPDIVAAINRQTEQYYMIQEYKYRVEREAEESKRKQIEANGIAAFQRTVSQGISDSYLRWRGIEATMALAQSRNSKIVIIGNGKDGLPIILGNVETPAASSETPATGTGQTSAPPEATPGTAEQPPSNAAPAAPGAMPPSGKSGAAEPTGGAPAASAASVAKPPSTPSPAAVTATSPPQATSSDLQSILSRISGAVLPGSSTTTSGPTAKPK